MTILCGADTTDFCQRERANIRISTADSVESFTLRLFHHSQTLVRDLGSKTLDLDPMRVAKSSQDELDKHWTPDPQPSTPNPSQDELDKHRTPDPKPSTPHRTSWTNAEPALVTARVQRGAVPGGVLASPRAAAPPRLSSPRTLDSSRTPDKTHHGNVVDQEVSAPGQGLNPQRLPSS